MTKEEEEGQNNSATIKEDMCGRIRFEFNLSSSTLLKNVLLDDILALISTLRTLLSMG